MGLFSMLKRNARLALRDNWGRAIIIMLITLGVMSVLIVLRQAATLVFVINPARNNPTMEPAATDALTIAMQSFQISPAEWIIIGVSTIMSLLLASPLVLGTVRWFYSLVHGKALPISEVFYFFETGKAYGRAIWYDINISIRCLLWAIPFYLVPGGIFLVSAYYLKSGDELSRLTSALAGTGIFLSAILSILTTIFYAACVYRYTLTPYLLSENGDLTVGQAIKISVKYTKGFRFSLVWFDLSYIGWIFLGAFIFPLLYVWPYYSTGLAMYARFMIEKNRYDEANPTKEFSVQTNAGEPVEIPPEAPAETLSETSPETLSEAPSEPSPESQQETISETPPNQD